MLTWISRLAAAIFRVSLNADPAHFLAFIEHDCIKGKYGRAKVESVITRHRGRI